MAAVAHEQGNMTYITDYSVKLPIHCSGARLQSGKTDNKGISGKADNSFGC